MRLRPGLVAVALLVALPHRPSYAQARISSADSAIIARELAAWDALQKDDSGAAFQRVVGNSPTWVIVGPGGITRSSAAEMGRQITVNCDRRSNPIDSASVDHISNDVVILTYNVTVEGRCGSETAWTTTPMYSLTVWARKEGRWQLVAQGIAPRPPGDLARHAGDFRAANRRDVLRPARRHGVVSRKFDPALGGARRRGSGWERGHRRPGWRGRALLPGGAKFLARARAGNGGGSARRLTSPACPARCLKKTASCAACNAGASHGPGQGRTCPGETISRPAA